MKRLTSFLLVAKDFEDHAYCKNIFYEDVFKFDNITNERVNEVFPICLKNKNSSHTMENTK